MAEHMTPENELARLKAAIKAHYDERGHDRCQESDNLLYQTAGLEPIDPQLPPIQEHRHQCDRWRSQKYGTSITQEPCYQLDKQMREMLAVISAGNQLAGIIHNLSIGIYKISPDIAYSTWNLRALYWRWRQLVCVSVPTPSVNIKVRIGWFRASPTMVKITLFSNEVDRLIKSDYGPKATWKPDGWF